MATLYLRDYPTAYHHEPRMPPLGVAIDLLRHTGEPQSEVMRFWLLTHVAGDGDAFWAAAVLRECLPDPDAPMVLVLDGEPWW